MGSIEPYEISVSDSKIESLRKKLEAADFPDELELGDAKWDLGAPLADLKRLATYWKDQYDWRKHEAEMNELPNFHTTIQAEGFEPLDIHFLHQKSEVAGAIPLLFSHGWVRFLYQLSLIDNALSSSFLQPKLLLQPIYVHEAPAPSPY